MRTNLVQTCKTSANRINLNRTAMRVALIGLFISLGITNAWGNSDYYSQAGVAVKTGAGTVYVGTSTSYGTSTTGSSVTYADKKTTNAGSAPTDTWYIKAVPDAGYVFTSWTTGGSWNAAPNKSTAITSGTITASTSTAQANAQANFTAVSVSSAPANIDLAPTDPSAVYPVETSERTLTFTTSTSNALTDFTNSPANGASGKFTFANWRRVDATHVAVDNQFSGGGSYGGVNRTNSVTVSLKGVAHSTTKSCTITANFPNAKITDGSADEVFATYKSTDATQEGVAKTAVFDVEYVDGTNNFDIPTFTGADASHFAYNSMSYADGKLTVNYTYNGNKENGTHVATLTLKVNDAIGGTDATYGSKAITITAHNEEEATNDASVTTTANVTTEYATFAQALAAANATSGATLTLLRNVDLGTIAATNSVNKAMTIELNGKTLQANVTTAISLLTIGKNVAVTIQDSKSGGMIYNTGEIDGVVYGVTVSKGTLNVTSGTIKAENTQQYFYGTSSVGGTATNKTGVGARGIQQAAATTVNISGNANIQAIASRNAFGIREESSNANTTTLNITGGTIYAEAPALAYGVYAYGKVNMSKGVVSTKLNTNLVNGNETWMSTTSASKWANNAVHREGHGIYMSTYARAAKTSCYYGTLTMTGGSISVVNENTTLVGTAIQSEPIYGVYFGASVYGVGAGKTATDGTMSQKASAIGSISNATITVNNSSQPSYGVMSYGYYNSADESEGLVNIDNSTVNVTSYQSAYGILANVGISSDYGGCYAGRMMLENNNVTTTTTTGSTSVALYATGTMTTIKTATSATYAGEYASSGYIYVKSGNYTANSKTSYATAAIAGPWTTSNAQRGAFKTYFAVDGSLGGNVESMSGIYISGGKFVANATTSHARGVWNSGTTIIAGGTFEANATTTNAYGIYSNRGVVQATGATLKAVAGTGTAYGVYSDAMINEYVGWKYAADYTLTNCNITASTTTGNTAYGVYINGTMRTISSVNSSYASIGDVVLGGYAIVGNASVKGCTINATSAGTTAGGIYRVNTQVSANKLDICQGELTATGNTITAKTNGGKTVYGIRSGGPSTISNNTITATSSSTDSYGVIVGDGEHTISGNTITASGTGTVYGIQTYSAVNSTTGYKFQANATLEDNTVTATTTSGNTAYAVYVTTADGVNIASGDFAGDYVAAGSMVINSGKYTATAAGTTGYALVLDATKTKNAASGSATCTVNGGKFKGTASSTYADVNASAGLGNLVLAGGYYVVNTNLNTYVADGYTATSLTSGDAYTEGYRYQISSEATGAIVCKVYSGSTLKASYQSLEEAIGYVNQNASTTLTILMVDNYTLSEGEYTLPAKTTLLVPYSGQTTAKTTSLERVYAYTKPTANIKLSFAPNAHLDVLGTIEAGSKQAGSGQTAGYNGAPHLSYGWIYLSAGSSMTLENGAKLFAWGYVTGAGEIDAKRGSTVYEMFQLTDWRGGTAISGMEGNSQKVMPVNQYYIQNVECPIKFRPGAVELCEGSCNMSSSVYPVRGKNSSTSIQFIGITGSGSLFMMDDEDVSNDTWVRKSYDAVNDKQVYEINSSAKIGGISITCCNLPFIGSKTLSSTDYVMPITNNLKIHLLSGSMYITQNLELAAGAEIEVDKEATAYVNSGVSLYVFDTDEWDVFETKYNSKTYPVRYTPSWTTCPRSVSNVPDAAINVHGKFIVNGNLYTTASGANIFSTNEDAGSITYNVSAPTGTKTVYVCNNTSQTYNSKTCYPAWLQNGTGITPAYSETAGTAAGKTWSYYDDKWQCWTQSGCFTYDALDNKYIKPAAYVQVTSTPDANHLYTDAATGTRKFVWDADCYWWEVETIPTAEGYYKAINADHNGKYNYYYYDSVNDYWVIKTIVVTWSINGSTTNYTVKYGTVPKWLGANPSIAATASVYYSWDGWTKGSTTGTFYSKYEDLPIATEAVTYYAHFETNKYSYTITFADANNGTSVSKTFTADEIPVCPITPVKAPTTALMYTYDGWSTTSGGSKDYDKNDNLPAVSGTATYYAHFSSSARPYTITFQNYDGTVLQQSDVNYGTVPTYAGATPYRAKDAFYSYTFSEWSPAITSVTGEATYTAQYTSTTRGFTIQFVDYDGTVLEVKDVPRGQTPEYTGSSISRAATVDKTYTFNSWSPALVEVTEDAIYTATYNETPREYTITWVDGNGATLKTDQVAYGETPAYSGSTPTKASTDDHSYVFNNTWLPAIVAVTGEATYTAQFNETERKYRVTWDAATNGGTCATEYSDFSYNAAIGTLPVASKVGYTFSGWFTQATGGTQITTSTKVTADVTYHAQFTINSHSLTWKANGGTLSGSYTSGTVAYGTTIAVPTVTRDGYIFDGWHDGTSIVDPASSMPDNDLTYTAQWTLAVASVAASGTPTTYHATVADAISAANGKTNAVVTMLQNASVASEVTITAAMTIDLNGKTISSTQAAATGVFKISASGKTVTINGAGGTINHTANASVYGINVAAGTTLNMTGGTVIADGGSGNPRGIYVRGASGSIATVSLTDVTVESKSTGDNSIAVYTYSYTDVTIHSGTYTATATSSSARYAAFTRNESGSKITIEGGKFNGQDKDVHKGGTTATISISGGYYVHDKNIETYCATNHHVFPASLTEGGVTYNFEVAEAYMITFKNGDDVLQSTAVKKGAKPAYSGATPTKAADATNVYTFAGWSDGVSTYASADIPAVSGAVTYTATYNSAPTVASVTVSGETTYYNTIEAAFAAANSSVTYDPTITLLRDASTTTTTFISYTGARNCTLNLNGHTLSSTKAQALLYINADITFTITDLTESKSGTLHLESTSTDNRWCVYVANGNLQMDAGIISLHSKADQFNEAVRIDPAASTFTMNGGKVHVVTSDSKTACGIASRGVAVINGGEIQVEASGAGYGIEARVKDSNIGNVTVYGGKFLVTGSTAACAYKSAANATLKLQGGYYNTNTNLEANCATNYHVLPLTGEDPYKYEVAEAYQLAWNLDGGTVTTAGTQAPVDAIGTPSGYVAKGATLTAPVVEKTGYTFDGWNTSGGTAAATMPAANTTYTATWNCVSPSSLSISETNNKGDFCSGENMTLEVSGSNIAIDATYQWKLNGSNISGANSSTYTVTGMTLSNAGTYSCTVTNGSCSKTSSGYDIKVWTFYHNASGSFAHGNLTFSSAGKGTITIELAADQTYEFKLNNNMPSGNWFGNTGTMTGTIDEASAWVFGSSVSSNCRITAGLSGNYVFNVDYSNSGSPKVSVTYPTAIQPSGRKIYFDKSGIDGWGDNVYYRIGNSSHNANQALSVVPGTDQFYEVTTDSYPYGFEAWQIANNVSWSGDNSIYLVNGSGYEITKATNFQKYVVDASGITIVPTTSHNTENGCNYWNVNTTSGMLTHKATITAPTNGTITIAYTDVNGASQSFTSGSCDLAHRCILTITATPTAGYRLASLTVNGGTFDNPFILTTDVTIAATFESTETGFYADIVDVDNSAKTLTLNTNGWASSGWPYDVNDETYTKENRKSDRTIILSYGDRTPGETFSITVKNKSNEVVSLHTYIIPTEIKTDANLAEQQLLFVKSGATLTVNTNKEVKNIYVDPDAKLVVNSGITLKADTVFLRTTPWASAELELDGSITGQVCYTRIIKKKDQYYQFGLPMDCPIANVRLSDGSTPTYGNGWLLRSYSESKRATQGSGSNIDNWTTLTNEGADANKTIHGGVGYEMFSNSGYYREYYFPIAHTGLSDRVAVTRTTDETVGASHEGWNIVVSPLLSTFNQDPAPEDLTVSWLQEDGSYQQLPVGEIKPAIPFSYQASETGYIIFDKSTVAMPAPRRQVKAADEDKRIQWIHLDVAEADGLTDQTSIYSHPTRYAETYQTGIDVAKQSLTASRAILYTTHAYGDMAFAGVSDSLLERGVALTVYSPKTQELTISMRENDWLNRMSAVWLIDHETGMSTDLLWNDYTFDALAGTMSGRFIIKGVFLAPGVATGLQNDGMMNDGMMKARKVIIDQKMYIQINGRLYDANGKLLKTEH